MREWTFDDYDDEYEDDDYYNPYGCNDDLFPYDYEDDLEYFEKSAWTPTWKDRILQAIYYTPRWHLVEFWNYKLGMKRCSMCGRFYFQKCKDDCIPF